jgi:hypothetical protein
MQNLQNSSLHCFRTNLEHLERYFSITVDHGKKFSERIANVEREFCGKESAMGDPVPKLSQIYMELSHSYTTHDEKTKKNQ